MAAAMALAIGGQTIALWPIRSRTIALWLMAAAIGSRTIALWLIGLDTAYSRLSQVPFVNSSKHTVPDTPRKTKLS